MPEFILAEALMLLAVTILIEAFVLIMMLKSPARAILVAFVINIISWPVGTLLYYFGGAPWLFAEASILMVETALLSRIFGRKRDVALLTTIAINIPSAVFTLIMQYL
ncbi:MAG: hypothetical protein N3H30_01625 [Candidatus Micrarchaeota archaeon]|nr:hypothetical protein [Candidatus Micrarchaeota archaeon]